MTPQKKQIAGVALRQLALLCGLAACAGDGANEPAADQGQEPLAGEEDALSKPHGANYYLRCGATSKHMDQESQLRKDVSSGALSLDFEVTPGALLEQGDHCVVSRRSAHGRPRHFSTKSTLVVPGQVTLQRSLFAWPFRVVYPSAGKYHATFDPDTNKLEITAAASTKTVFSAIESFGDSANYQALTPARWSVSADEGDDRYFLNTTAYAGDTDGTLGEYSLYAPNDFGDFVLKVTVRTAEDLASNPSADFAVVYGYLDSQNYSFMSFSAQASETQLVRVAAGERTVIATATVAGITDDRYHTIELWRHGPAVRALVDHSEILIANEPGSEVGKLGLGSIDDSAYFDDPEAYSYYSLQTDHYTISLPTNQKMFEDSVASILENAYAVNLANTGWDINQRMGHERYDYRYRPSGWRWFDDANGCCELGGGLTISGGPSVVVSELVPESQLPADRSNFFVAISLHELGNGWFLPGVTIPEWVEWLRSESHSGFLRAEAELDLGYCFDANREHKGHYEAYLATSLDDRRLYGNAVEPLLLSLRERYGWGLFRDIYDASLAGDLDYLADLSSSDRDNEIVLRMSKHVGEDLSAFFARELGVSVRDDVRVALQSLPRSDLTVLSSLPCHAPAVRAWPDSLVVSTPAATPAPITRKLYVQAPADWTFTTSGPADWLTIERAHDVQATTLTLTFHPGEVCPGVSLSTELIITASGIEQPRHVPVSFSLF